MGPEPAASEEPGIREAFSIFIYPFFFRQDNYKQVLENILRDPAWKLEIIDLLAAEEQRHLRYFYPYVRRFLFPSAYLKLEELSCFSADKLHFKGRSLHIADAVRNRKKKVSIREQVKVLQSWLVVRWRWDFTCFSRIPREFTFFGQPARFEKVSLLLFSTGVGLLLLEVKPEEVFNICQLREFNRRFGVLEEMSYGKLKPAELEIGSGGAKQRRQLRDVILEDFLGFLPSYLREGGSYASGEAMLLRYCFLCVSLQETGSREEYLQEVVGRFAGSPQFPLKRPNSTE